MTLSYKSGKYILTITRSEEALKCMMSYSVTEVSDMVPECPVPCEEVELYTMAPFNDLKGKEDETEKKVRWLTYYNVNIFYG